MSTLREAAQQALEALEYLNMTAEHRVDDRITDAAITALRAALAQEEQEQEPVARVVAWKNTPSVRLEWCDTKAAHNAKPGPLYAHPPRREWRELSDQEPVLTINKLGSLVECSPTIAAFTLPDGEFSLYTHPPRREWVSLTDEDYSALFSAHYNGPEEFARAIEQALRSKNNE